MSEEQNRFNEPEDKFAATDADVEAHKLNQRMGTEPEDKFAATDEDDADVEGHMLGHKPDAGKMSS
jgi:hypothetical protein